MKKINPTSLFGLNNWSFIQDERSIRNLVNPVLFAFVVGGLFFCAGKYLSTKTEPIPFRWNAVKNNRLDPRIEILRENLLKRGYKFSPHPGNSHIYLNPKEPSLLIKDRGQSSWSPDERLANMEIIRKFLNKKQFSNLVVPKAQKEDEYLIEERLPLQGSSYQEQIDLYLHNLKIFTPAVKEFTELLFCSNFTDLLLAYGNRYLIFSKCPIPRWDNIPMYVTQKNDKKVGKIGLIDLEHCSLKTDSEIQQQDPLSICIKAIRLFPYHLDSILEVGLKYFPCLNASISLLKKEQEKALIFFRKIYHSPVAYLKDCKILLENPGRFILLQPSNKIKIIKALSDDKELSRFFSSDAAEEVRKQVFAKILETVQEFNKNSFESALKTKKTPSSIGELLKYREVQLYPREIPLSERESCKIEPLHKQLMKKLNANSSIENTSEFVISTSEKIYKLLLEERVIGGFQSRFYGNSDLIFF